MEPVATPIETDRLKEKFLPGKLTLRAIADSLCFLVGRFA